MNKSQLNKIKTMQEYIKEMKEFMTPIIKNDLNDSEINDIIIIKFYETKTYQELFTNK